MSCAIIVLGSPNDENGNLLPIAISRCEKAFAEYTRIGDCKILCTGGYGKHFNTTKSPHGLYSRRYLENKGIPSAAFLEIALSAFTLEDATLSKPILAENAITHVVLVTSDFHMARAKLIFDYILPDLDFQYAKAETQVPRSEFQRLIQHEEKAIKRELSNLKLGDSLAR